MILKIFLEAFLLYFGIFGDNIPRHFFFIHSHILQNVGMSGADYLRCKDACVFRAVDRDGRDRNAGRHLRSGEERIDASSRFVHYWDADNGERRVSRNDTREMRGASLAADKYP